MVSSNVFNIFTRINPNNPNARRKILQFEANPTLDS